MQKTDDLIEVLEGLNRSDIENMAINSTDHRVRKRATELLDNQELLIQIVICESYYGICKLAVERITDEYDLMEEYIKNERVVIK